MLNRFRHCGSRLVLLYFFTSVLNANNFTHKGHIKAQSLLTNYPSDSLFQDFSDDPSSDQNAGFRLNLSLKKPKWTWQADYQFLVKHGDSVALAQQSPDISFTTRSINDDDFRLMDLTDVSSQRGQTIMANRLDRLHVTYSAEQAVVRIGRQAVSWGNGLVYNPMDFFNPFDPASIDKEYKTGDDMLYSQYLFDNGNDLQAVWVGRRDEDGDNNNQVSSTAAKYHVFLENYEFDFLAAEHFDNKTIGIGGVTNVGGSIWRSDIVSTEINHGWRTSAILNVSYSWLSWGKNMSGHVELYRNGFGIDDGDYSPGNLAENPELLSRIRRGELFTLGRHNLAASATLELTPLWLLTSTLFTNLDDDSQVIQFVSQHDLQQNLQLLVAVNLPQGNEGSEFGGIDSGLADKPLSIDESLFVQLAYYF